MKKHYVLLLMFGIGLLAPSSHAQDSVKRYVFMELFTNVPCPRCASQNPSMFERIEPFQNDLHQISFYPGQPYSSCPLYDINRSDNEAQTANRGITGTPTVVLNGIERMQSRDLDASVLTPLIDGQSAIEVGVVESGMGLRDIDVEITNIGDDAFEGRLFVAYVQRSVILEPGSNIRERENHNVFQDFLTPVAGAPVSIGAQGSSLQSYQVTTDVDWEAEGLYTIAWIEDMNGMVVNSGTRFDDMPSSTEGRPVTSSLKIHPVPARDVLHIDYEGTISSADIIDGSGRLQLRTQSPSRQLDIRALSAGGYTLIIRTAEGIIQKRFVKM